MKQVLILTLAPFIFSVDSPAQRYLTRPLQVSPEASQRSLSFPVPTWTATTDGYTYQMVGQSPYTAQPAATATTTIATPVIPIVLTFSDGAVFDPTAPDKACSAAGTPASLMMSSPLFNASKFAVSGSATESDQYIDYFQRANFWQYTGPSGVNPNYHLSLTGSIGTALKVTVPAANGSTVATPCGRMGQVELDWLDSYINANGFKTNGITASQLPVFMLYNVAMYEGSSALTSSCCVLGYHSASIVSGAIQTYVVADFDTSGRFGSTADVSPFSHEIAEWADDPLGTNPTPPWGNIGEVTGCQSNLEVGDPLAGTNITITMPNAYTYHVQELAFLSWFYHQSPSIGLNGWYSSDGTFKAFANACSATRTTLSLSPSNIPAGGSTTANITVKPTTGTGVPTGTVTLVSGATGKTLDTFTLASGAVANANVTNPPSGSYAVTANYAGDGTYSPSTSTPVSVNVGTSTVSFSPVVLSFGTQTLNTASSAQSVKLTNNGTAALTSIVVSLAGASPGDYSQTNTCGTSVAAGANCMISVTFKPKASGLRTASISVADNATGSPQTVPLTGIGVGPTSTTFKLSTMSLTFGNENLGSSSASQTVTLSNTGTASFRPSISLGGANPGDFPTDDNCPRNLAAGASCTITVTFKPEATGALASTLSVSAGFGGAAQSVTLAGTGVSTGTPAVTLTPASLTFGSQPEGSQSAGQTVTVKNTGTGVLSITSIAIAGTNAHDFTVSGNCSSLLAAGSSCTLSVRLRPIETGSLTAALSITDSAAGSPQTVSLTGTGTQPVPTHGH